MKELARVRELGLSMRALNVLRNSFAIGPLFTVSHAQTVLLAKQVEERVGSVFTLLMMKRSCGRNTAREICGAMLFPVPEPYGRHCRSCTCFEKH